MSFEVKGRDLLGRIGRLETKSGAIETPLLLPVINPVKVSVEPKEMMERFGCEAVITNAYIVKRNFGEEAEERGIHGLLDYPGVVMTDSGAYQILLYGDVEIDPEGIVLYQEAIGSDIATILDIPTGWRVSEEYARYTVEETLRRAEALKRIKRRDDILWVGPIQGGQRLDLVAYSARRMGSLPFQIHALGSPTPVMERYLFDVLVDMIMAAKGNIPPNRPLHLFGAGHPFMFALVVALGCDLFDSAAYSLYARGDRYMTERGTLRLSRLDYLPCSCPICSKRSPKDLSEMPKAERERELALHNLYVCFSEMRKIKQAISEGRLWEHLEMRAHGHPSLLQAVRRLRKYSEYLERHTPVTKRSGLFFYGALSLIRPEVLRHRRKILERYSPPAGSRVLLLIPEFWMEPPRRSRRYEAFVRSVRREVGEEAASSLHVCLYGVPFGVIPLEIREVYPLSQYEVALPPESETEDYVVETVLEYIKKARYKMVLMVWERCPFGRSVAEACGSLCKSLGIPFKGFQATRRLTKDLVKSVAEALTHPEKRRAHTGESE